MSVSLTTNLGLRVDSNLTANAKFNLNQIDTLGAFLNAGLVTLDGVQSLTNKTLDVVRFFLNGHTTIIRPAQTGQLVDITFTLPRNTGVAGQVLTTDGSGGMSWTSVGGSSVQGFEELWAHSDGTTKVVTHNLGSSNVEVSLINLDDNTLLMVDSVVVTSSNSITLSSSEAPNTNWRVVIQAS